MCVRVQASVRASVSGPACERVQNSEYVYIFVRVSTYTCLCVYTRKYVHV